MHLGSGTEGLHDTFLSLIYFIPPYFNRKKQESFCCSLSSKMKNVNGIDNDLPTCISEFLSYRLLHFDYIKYFLLFISSENIRFFHTPVLIVVS